ncbi:MAG: DUF3078 domain-containing protein [Polyangiaceae bacterium]|nr:DUF3078 domain-containing protein [Polyangiaceae bacterium]
MNRRLITPGLVALGSATLLAAHPALADEPPKLESKGPQYVIDPAAPAPKKDLDWRMLLGANFSLSDNRQVIGQTDGTTVTFGYKLDAAVNYAPDDHEWRNTLVTSAAMQRSPSVDDLVKARDSLAIESIYLYHAVKSVGPFARATLDTAVYPGYDVRAVPVSYLVSHEDGLTETIFDHKLRLTDPMRPLALKQSIGAFFQPVSEEEVTLEIRAALGGRETVAKGQLAVDDDKATDVVEVKELRSSNQLGAEATVQVTGTTAENRLVYKATAEVLVPFVHSELAPDDERNVGQLTSLAFGAALAVKLVDWATLDYEVKAVREPLTLDAWQVQNNLVLTFGLTVPIPKPEPPPECKK